MIWYKSDYAILMFLIFLIMLFSFLYERSVQIDDEIKQDKEFAARPELFIEDLLDNCDGWEEVD